MPLSPKPNKYRLSHKIAFSPALPSNIPGAGFEGQPVCKRRLCGQERERGRGAGAEGGEDPGDGAAAEAEDGGGEEICSPVVTTLQCRAGAASRADTAAAASSGSVSSPVSCHHRSSISQISQLNQLYKNFPLPGQKPRSRSVLRHFCCPVPSCLIRIGIGNTTALASNNVTGVKLLSTYPAFSANGVTEQFLFVF